ncbi:uncharacterized protein LOC115756962 isoform X2 [Rhodamnia argentea]|uniref:Uncharacterized protein LOC115756962 isoform X2 n=1 Tax=Rhodamnia argentea TaxID=178133 RepID=A0ABM3HNQ8_9MYRT|nr:uncharacterized protein LOC115756962 isoform X2 [Rhodamnia argentea]
MRDGLRSGKLRAKPEKGELVSGKMLVQKKLVNTMPKGTDLGDEKTPALASDNGEACEESSVPLEDGTIVSDKMVIPGSKCGEVVLTGEGLCNGALEDSRKRSWESCGEGTQCHEPIKKILKEEALDGGVHFVARVLRSRTVISSVVGKVGAKAEKRAAELLQKRREGPGFQIVTAQAEEDRVSNLVEPSFQKLKRKRGRPPKLLGKKKGKVLGLRKNERISKTKHSVKQTSLVSSSNRGRRSNGNRYKVKRTSPAKKGKHVDLEVGENLPSSGPSLKLEKSSCNEHIVTKGRKRKKDGEVGLSRREQKGLVRDRVVELLMSAGWTIEYRPRQNREYNDAVYLSPDGKTHWSVTLAYNVLKMRYEAGDAESKAYKTGFVFSPIPEEELSILNKVITKKRVGKKKASSKIAGAIKKKKHKGKLRFGASANKQSQGKRKGKTLLSGKENMSGATRKGTPLLIGTRKRRETQDRKRFALLVRNSDGTQPDSENYVLYSGKRTILAWMIDLGTVLDKGKVQYWHPEKTLAKLGGTITRDGIRCDCCGEVITVSEFEAHAGSKLRQPLENIYLENGMSMLQCQLDSWKKQEETGQKRFHFIDVGGDDPNDDTCGICGDGGNLVCCDGCPSTFHQSCIDIQFPSGDWHCLYCSCKYCGTIGESTREKDSDEDTTSSALFKCQLCEEKYHSTCVLAEDAVEGVQILSSFCGKSCQKLYEDIGMLLGVKHELGEGYSFTLVHRFLMDIDICSTDISRKVQCNSKVAVALSVMDECFLPVSDHRSGIDMIHNILYNCGSNFSRLDFSGFYTAILEKGEEMIAAASIRIHGNQLAEMPFIGTRYAYRRRGMCRRLLNAIESVLRSLKVRNLVIPAISELKETWTSVFGFEPMDVSLKKSLRRMNIVVFPGVDMLQKLLLNHDNAEEKAVLPIDLNATCEDTSPDVNTMEGTTSPDINMMGGTPATTPDVHDINAAPTVDKSTPFLDSSPNDTSDITSDSVDISDCLEEKKDLAQLGGLYDTEERNDVHPHKLTLSDNFARVSDADLNLDEGKGFAESDESHDTAERKNVHLNTAPSASDNNTHVSETDLNRNEREHLANERKDLAHLDEPFDSAERKNVPANTLPSVSENFIHPLQTDLNQNERKDLAQLDEPYDTADRKTVPLSTMPSASDNFTHLSETDCNHNGICGLLLPISHIATSKVDAKLRADSGHTCAESCSSSDRADFVDHFALQECAQIVDADVDCKSNPTGGFPTSHTGHSEVSSGDAGAERQVSASANGSTCSESETFHDARDDMLSTSECLSDSGGKMLLDELKSCKGTHLVSSAPSDGCTPSTRSCNQLLKVTHSNHLNEVCPSADERSKVVANGGFAVPPVDCNPSPCQANGVVTSQGLVDSDCVDVRNQEPFEAPKNGTEKPHFLSPTSNGHGISFGVKSDSKKQPVDGIH